MIGEVFLNANSKYHFENCIQDPAEYMKLTDHILKEIEFSKEPVLTHFNTFYKKGIGKSPRIDL